MKADRASDLHLVRDVKERPQAAPAQSRRTPQELAALERLRAQAKTGTVR